MALVEIARFYNSIEAGVARSRLEADGIAAFLFDMEMSTAGALLIPVRLMVDDDDEGQARRILEEDGFQPR